MADVTVTSGYPKLLGTIGANSLYLWRITDVDDTETLATGLGNRIVDFWIRQDGNVSTQASAGISASESSGTITFYPGEDNLGASVFVLASGM